MDTRQTAFRAEVVDIVLDEVLDRADFGVVDLGEIVAQVVVEVDLDVGVRGLIDVAASGTVVPVPTVWRDDLLVVR
jgi:hypothetical protein